MKDDENPNEVTAGAIVTVTVELKRMNMSEFFGDNTPKSVNEVENNEEEKEGENVDAGAKRPVWMKQKKGN